LQLRIQRAAPISHAVAMQAVPLRSHLPAPPHLSALGAVRACSKASATLHLRATSPCWRVGPRARAAPAASPDLPSCAASAAVAAAAIGLQTLSRCRPGARTSGARAALRALASPALAEGILAYAPGFVIDDTFVSRLLATQASRPGDIVLSLPDALRLVEDACALLRKEATLSRADVDKVVVVGDLHGQFFDLLHIFELAGLPSEDNPYLFNGDFVDRGPYSLEVIFTLFALKLRFPDAVFMNRGNHESVTANLRYGFAEQIWNRYGADGEQLFHAFSEAFRWLPLAHVLNAEVFVVHGGLPGPDPRLPFRDAGGGGTGYDAVAAAADGSQGGRRGGGQNLSLLGYNPDNVSLPPRDHEVSLEQIAALPRGIEPASDLKALDDLPEDKAEVQRLVVDLLWADPRGKTGYGPSFRVQKGCYIFGPDVTAAFLEKNGLRLMIRSHEVKVNGYEWTHPSLISVFSAANYLGHARNKGAIVSLKRDPDSGHLEPSFLTYDAKA